MFSKEQKELIDSLKTKNFPVQWFKEEDSLIMILNKYMAIKDGVNLHRLSHVLDNDKYTVLLTGLASGLVIDTLLSNLHCPNKQFYELTNSMEIQQGFKVTNRSALKKVKPETSEAYKTLNRLANLGLDITPFVLGLNSLEDARILLQSEIQKRQQQIETLLKYYQSAGYSSTQLSALRVGMDKCQTLVWFGANGIIKQNHSEEEIYCIMSGLQRGFNFSEHLEQGYTVMQLKMILRMDRLQLNLNIASPSVPAPLLKCYCDFMEGFNLYKRYEQESTFLQGKSIEDIYSGDMRDIDYIRLCRKKNHSIHWLNQLEELVCANRSAISFIER